MGPFAPMLPLLPLSPTYPVTLDSSQTNGTTHALGALERKRSLSDPMAVYLKSRQGPGRHIRPRTPTPGSPGIPASPGSPGIP